MKTVNYIMRKKEEKYIITRYIFENNKLIEKFWVNTYYNKQDANDYFNTILDCVELYKWNLIKKVYCDNIWEIIYTNAY